MPRRSYLQRIVLGHHGPVVLSPPRVLFRPTAVPIESVAGAEAVAAASPPAEARTVATAASPPAEATAVAPALEPRSVLISAPTVPIGPAGPQGPLPSTATSKAAHRQALVTPAELLPRPVGESAREAMPPPLGVPVAGPSAGADEAPLANTPGVAPAPISQSAAPPASAGLSTGPPLRDPQRERPELRPVDAATSVEEPELRPVDRVTERMIGEPADGVDQRQPSRHMSSSVRLEPPAVAPPPHRPDNREREARVRIGSLEVRIVPPAAGQVPAAHPPAAAIPPVRPAPPVRMVAPLSRGFRPFGLVQG
jgi:hypothetical protein